MNSKRQFELYAEADQRRRGITIEKGAEYTGDSSDVLLNFKEIGKRLGVNPLLVLAIYFNKHVDSFNTFVKRVVASDIWGDGPPLSYLANEGEGIVSRMDDGRNYYDLAEALVCDLIDEYEQRSSLAPWEGTPKPPLWEGRSQGLMVNAEGFVGPIEISGE